MAYDGTITANNYENLIPAIEAEIAKDHVSGCINLSKLDKFSIGAMFEDNSSA